MKKITIILKENKGIVNNIIGSFIIRGGSLIISLLTMPAYLKYFDNQTVLGLWFTILAVINWVLMFDLGIGNGLRNKLPAALVDRDYEKAQKYISSTYLSTGVLILILCMASFFVFPYIPWNRFFNISNQLISHDILVTAVIIVFIGIMIQLILKLITSILYAIQKSAFVNFLVLLSNVIILAFILTAPNMSLDQSLIVMSLINVFAVNMPLLITTIIIFSNQLKNCRPTLKKYSNKVAIEILKIGSVLLWLQTVMMIISSTNEFLISFLTNPTYVFEYQIYYKIFNAVGSIFVLALVPIWSAVTKAQAEGNYLWINKLSKILLIMAGVAFLMLLAVVPFFQTIVNIWLGDFKININTNFALLFALSSSIFILHNVNTSLGNGMSFFRIQIIWMTFAAVVNIPLAILFVDLTGGWIGIILANIISLLPYEILEPIYFNRYINKKIAIHNIRDRQN